MRKAAKAKTNQFAWKGCIEILEDRRVMTADPLFDNAIEQHCFEEEEIQIEHQLVSEPDFWLDTNYLLDLEDQLDSIEQTLYSAHNTTGLNSVVTNYGFTGIGQTVAVIDSGIAYDHFALGGGFGSNYRVVGGWDFTGENDANPYDDGPSGSHGTHVAGIIGGSEGNDKGVAPGVDLVALRVFDDSGAGYFSWVENALRWVINNRNSFENPITAINLSLGVASWNTVTVPAWSTLEDEFRDLEAAGIFIAVSAGNSYASYKTPGLSYPAASPYVVPVMSVTDAGVLASYSQRDVRAIAAPGSSIRSTVPDYKGNNNGITDDYAIFSGTSMASPYVAGASVLIRQAMEFAGRVNITQDMIYDHMMATATSFVDSSTGLTFKRLNISAAINALMPTDDYGSTVATAHNLGSLNGSREVSGVISTLSDVDYMKFTATTTGTVSFSASNMTHQMDVAWSLANDSGTLSNNGDTFTFNVVAGQTYTVGVSSTGGLGYYDLEIASTGSSFTFADLGAISYSQLSGLSMSGETWYRVQASQSGYLTVEGLYGANGQLNVQLYNANREIIVSGNSANGSSRVDTYATAGQEFYVCVVGNNSDAGLRLSNLVSVSGTTVNVTGTSSNDTFSFTAGNQHSVTVNGVTHTFSSIAVNEVNFSGGGGNDSINMTGTSGVENALVWSTYAELRGTGFTAIASGIENTTIYGGGGNDIAKLWDSDGDDVYSAQANNVEMTGSGYRNRALNFKTTHAYASTGNDIAYVYDTVSVDEYNIYHDRVVMSNNSYSNRVLNFDVTTGYSTQGNDTVRIYDSLGNDLLTATPDQASISGTGFTHNAQNFCRVTAVASQGFDQARLYDSAGNDILSSRPTKASMYAVDYSYLNKAVGFDQVDGYASTGTDKAFLFDSSGDDIYTTYPTYVTMTGAGYVNSATGFDRVVGYSTTGNDVANFNGLSNTNSYQQTADETKFSGNGFSILAYSFRNTSAFESNEADVDSYTDDKSQKLPKTYYLDLALQKESLFGEARKWNNWIAYDDMEDNIESNIQQLDHAFSVISE